VNAVERIGTQRLRETSKPSLDLRCRQLAQLSGAEQRDDVLRAQEPILPHGGFGPLAHAEGEPIIDGLADRIAFGTEHDAVVPVTQERPKLRLCLGLGSA